MESTGVHWKPVFNVLEGRLKVQVVNPTEVKRLPGRKTDVADAEWLAQLLQHGLLRASFIPNQSQRELRDLTRTRTTLIDERSRTVQRLQKVLEDANVKLTGVVTDLMGVSGREILDSLVAGTADASTLANLARGRLRAKRAQLEEALAARLSVHHRQLIGLHLSHVDFLDEQIRQLSAEIATRLEPMEEVLQRLETIPGVKRATTEMLAAEIGLDMQHFPSAKELASWGGMCPGNHQGAGKQRRGTTRKGSVWLRRGLVVAARAGARKKGCALAREYRGVVGRLGPKAAAVAVGHTILRMVYVLLTHPGSTYEDRSSGECDEELRARAKQHAVHQLEELGFEVRLSAKAA
jgi:transposase